MKYKTNIPNDSVSGAGFSDNSFISSIPTSWPKAPDSFNDDLLKVENTPGF